MLDPMHPTTHENLQLGEGVMLRGIDLDTIAGTAQPAAALLQAMQTEGCLIGATKAGSVFRCIPTMLDVTRGCRTPAIGETLAGRWEITLSGTLLEITPANTAMLLNTSAPMAAGSSTRITPAPTPVPGVSSDICWVGDMGSGLLAIQLHNPISTGGMAFRANRNGLGEAAFTLMAQKRSPEEQELPCRLLWLKEATA